VNYWQKTIGKAMVIILVEFL